MKISVIIPAFNAVSTLSRTIDSVLAQSYGADEIIVVDDGSSDATSEVAKMYSEVILLRQKRMGAASALNNGAMMASNEWIAFLEAADTWHPDKLQEQVACLRKSRHTKVICTDQTLVRGGREVDTAEKSQKPQEIPFDNCLSGCNMALSSLLIEKKLFDRLGGFDESMECCEDYDLWLRIMQEEKIAMIERKLVNSYGDAGDRSSCGEKETARFRVKALEKHLEGVHDAAVREELIRTLRVLAEGAKKDAKEEEGALYLARIEQLEAGV